MKNDGSYGGSPPSSNPYNRQGEDPPRGQGQRQGQGARQGSYHWEEQQQAQGSQSRSHRHHPSRQGYNSDSERFDHFAEPEEYIDDEDGEIYLKPGEPYGAWLRTVEDPYDRAVKIEEANRELFNKPARNRRTTIKVHFWEDRNEYYELYDESPSSTDYDANEVLYGRPRGERTQNSQSPNPYRGEPPPRRQSPTK